MRFEYKFLMSRENEIAFKNIGTETLIKQGITKVSGNSGSTNSKRYYNQMTFRTTKLNMSVADFNTKTRKY